MFNLYRKTWAAVGFILCLLSVVYAYSGGNGTVAEPYQIASVSDWNDLMNTSSDWNKYFIMTANINLEGITLTPVGNITTNFTGNFNGDEYIVYNAVINGSNYIGLFGYTGSTSQIRNLGVEDVNIAGSNYVGGLVGHNRGIITACYSTGLVNGSSGYVGGFCGYNNNGTITNCYSTVRVNGLSCVGGFCAGNRSGTITGCYSTGSVSGNDTCGGFCGYNYYYGTITDCYSIGAVVTGEDLGNDFGGFCGVNDNATITGCYSTGSVSDDDTCGGFCGWNLGESAIINNCYSTGMAIGLRNVGGLVGDNRSIISVCYSTGDVNGNNYVGGLVGYNLSTDSSIDDCYSTGAVVGDSNVGGLVGYINKGSIAACYSIGAVDGNSNVGGLIGYKSAGNVDSNSFWDVNTSGKATSAGGTGKTTAEMQDVNTFLTANWDFSTPVWKICNSTNYPKFAWQEPLAGDFGCPDGVDIYDFIVFVDQWLLEKLSEDIAPDGGDGIVNFLDWAVFANDWQGDMNELADFASQWLKSSTYCADFDIAPAPDGDGVVNFLDFALFANNWLREQ